VNRFLKISAGIVLIGLTVGGGLSYAQTTSVDMVKAFIRGFETGVSKRLKDARFEYGDIRPNASEGSVTVSDIRFSGLNNAGQRAVHTVDAATFRIGADDIASMVLQNYVSVLDEGMSRIETKRMVIRDFSLKDFATRVGNQGSEDERWAKFIALMNFTKFRAEGVKVIADADTTFTASSIDFDGVKNGLVDHFVLDNFSMTNDASDSFERAAVEYFSVRHFDLKHFKNADKPGLKSDFYGIKELETRNWMFKEKEAPVSFKLAEFSAKNIERSDGLIMKARFVLERLSIPLRVFQGKNPLGDVFMAQLKRENLVLGADIGIELDIDARTLVSRPTVISAEGLGRINAESRMTDIDIEAYRQVFKSIPMDNYKKALGSFPAANFQIGGKLDHSSFRYDDDRLADILFDMFSGGNRLAIAESASQQALAFFPTDPETGEAAAAAIHDFVIGANFYDISIKTDEPIASAEIARHWQNGTIGQILNIIFSGG